jgi:hypothetical protein
MTAAEPIDPDGRPSTHRPYYGGRPEPDDPRRCTGQRSDGTGRCDNWAIRGGHVCQAHGGGSPQARRGALERLLAEQALKLIPDPDQRAQIRDPVGALFEAAEEAQAVKDTLAVLVNELKAIGYRGGMQFDDDGRLMGVGTEQTRAEFVAYERALERYVKILVDIARLDLDTRRLRVEEWQRQQIAAATLRVLQGVCAQLGLAWSDESVRGMISAELRALPAVIEG